MIETGIKGMQEAVVLPEHTAKHIGSGTVLVLSTPMMIAMMERTCRMSVKPYLDEGQETVGTHVDVSHEKAVPVGKKIRCESEVIEIDRRRITFSVAVYDECGAVVGRGKHERFIIDEKRFGAKLGAGPAQA
ncbi:MAG: thioesterase family protein [Bacteroidales bacterium]|nr:thioesterase family protein [Bacteroidales bacterium]